MKGDNKGMKNCVLNASQKVIRNGLQRVFAIVVAKDEIRCCVWIHSNVPRDSTAGTGFVDQTTATIQTDFNHVPAIYKIT